MRYIFIPLLILVAVLSGLLAKKLVFGKLHHGCTFTTSPLIKGSLSLPKEIQEESVTCYSWESSKKNEKISPITKDYFRCKGSSLNPPIPVIQDGKTVENLFDCSGPDSHSLPLRHGKEFIYPILLELLNEIQTATARPIIITSGHRCPTHNRYIDSSPKNQTAKHMIGAEVSFYVAGLETHPEAALEAIFHFYRTHPRYAQDPKAFSFERYTKEVDVKTKPWFNKEVFVKLFTSQEGRNGDNRHPFPYISIQVRFDRDTNMRVSYSWPEAQQFLRR